MSAITSFNSGNVRIISESVEEALELVSEALGIQFKVTGCRYGTHDATMKIEMATVGDDGVAQHKEVAAFNHYAARYGLTPEDFGATFTSKSHLYEICGLKPRSKKYPILAKRMDGKTFKFSASHIKLLMGK